MSNVMQTYKRYSLIPKYGKGSLIYDESGKEFIDFSSGISVTNLGHSHPEITKVICEQSDKLIHLSNLYENPLQEELATKISCLSFKSEVFFCNSGAEANEAALKLARIIGNQKFSGRKNKIITMENSFHGRTFATLSATGQDKVKKGFEPIMDNIINVKFNDFDALVKECNDDVIAIMLEIVQGEGGLEKVSEDYLKSVRRLCDDKEILLIFDEVQTGIGRTGKSFAYQHYEIEPDIMTLAKALGNGMPIGAMVAKPEYSKYLGFGTHGSTFGGNFLACAVANKVLDIICRDEFLNDVIEKGKYLTENLQVIVKNKGIVKNLGLMCGIAFKNIDMNEFINDCMERRLLVIPAANNTVRFYPSLNIEIELIDKALEVVENIIKINRG
jgi:predicted acetylornithine/succinylornithine family transaminase